MVRGGNSGYRGNKASVREALSQGAQSRLERTKDKRATPVMEVQEGGSETVNAGFITRRYHQLLEQLPAGQPEEFFLTSLTDDRIKKLTENRVIKSSRVEPDIHDGINSLAMGYHGTGSQICSTCNISGDCTGHFGRINLNAPVINPVHMDKVMILIQCTCANCGNIFVDMNSFISINQTAGKPVIPAVWAASTKDVKACVHCHKHPHNIIVMKKDSSKFCQIVYTKVKPSEEVTAEREANKKARDEYKAEAERRRTLGKPEPEAPVKSKKKVVRYLLQHETVIKKLKRVNPVAARMLGISVLPTEMIMNYLMVVPPVMRPSMEIDGRVQQHPLTSGYKHVMEKNVMYQKSRDTQGRSEQLIHYSDLATSINYLIMGGKASSNQHKASLDVTVEQFANVKVKIPYEVLSASLQRELRDAEDEDGYVIVIAEVPSGNEIARDLRISVSVTTKKGGRIDHNSSINGILKTKHGEIVGRILSKRCEGGKAVLSIGHYLQFGQIGIPRIIANEFSIPMTVTAENYNLIQDLRKPTDDYPKGRIKKIRKVGSLKMVTLGNHQIEVGDEIQRVAMNGDIVIFNRFPIIHRYSMMAYTAVIHNGITIDLHQSALEPHNADFDGDTGVIRFPQSESARKAAVLMHIRRNLVSGSSGSSISGLIMDASLGAYFMTSKVEEMSEEQFRKHLMAVHADEDKVDEIVADMKKRVEYINKNIIGLNIQTFTTATLYSTSLPSGFSYQHEKAIIINGVVVYGTLHKPHLGTGQHSITRYLLSSHGEAATADYLTYSNWITVEWLDYHGLTIGTNDTYIQDEKFNQSVKNIVAGNIRRYYITYIRGRRKKENPADTERKAWSILESTQGLIADLFMSYCEKNTTVNNGLYHLIKSGKISKEIVSQIVGSVGVVTYFGQFCPEYEGRCTVYGKRFEEKDIRDPAELAFIIHNYAQGVSPMEALLGFRAAMGGSVSTNCATADFGHIYNLLNAVLTSNYSVSGMIVQYMNSVPKLIMGHSDVRGIDTDMAMSNYRKEFGLGNLTNMVDSINFKLASSNS